MSTAHEDLIERSRRLRREKLLAEFVDRSTEMALFERVLDNADQPVMAVTAASGMGKSSLLMRMVHECAQRAVLKAEVEWSATGVMDYLTVLRHLRDALQAGAGPDGPSAFSAFTDLVSYYTQDNYTPRLDINVNLQGGSVQVAGGASISGSTVGDIAAVVLRDNNITVQRADLAVSDEVRRARLTERFQQGLAQLSATRPVVLFFNTNEKLTDVTHDWLWDLLLKPVLSGQLAQVRAVVLGHRAPPDHPDWQDLIAHAPLAPLGLADIDLYIAKKAAAEAVNVPDDLRRGIAALVASNGGGRPADVAMQVQRLLKGMKS
jgi:hypothetical protein